MARCTVPEAEEILDRPFTVLDKGFVRLIDYMGSDQRIVQAARVSYGEGTKTYRRDRGLIHYLLRNGHTSPFEQVVYTFHVKLPVFVARQWIRHRTARVNEISGRYSVLRDEFYLPAPHDVAPQSMDNKQGRSPEPVPDGTRSRILDILRKGQETAYRDYTAMLEENIARELARINLPLSLFTEWYWQIDLHNLFHFLALRMDPHAQKEIRVYAETMHGIGARVCPIAFDAFDEHMRTAVTLSGTEISALKRMLGGEEHGLDAAAYDRLAARIGLDERKNG